MAYSSRVYRILIASPSDVEEEREVAVRVIQDWNDLHSYSRKTVLLPLRWETHTAPAYGARPQETINQAVVDECDLLVGIFWTRIGTPTGDSESGTLEEISRVALAHKPVMLYFSHVGADPDAIDLGQLERLRRFKEEICATALLETFKSQIDFRNKFAKQLEMKVRELQQSDNIGPPPLMLSFVSTEVETRGTLLGSKMELELVAQEVNDISGVPPDLQGQVGKVVEDEQKARLTVPVPLAVENKSPSGIRNVFVEMCIDTDQPGVQIHDYPPQGVVAPARFSYVVSDIWANTAIRSNVGSVEFFEKGLAQVNDTCWIFKFECDAIQPQRARHLKPCFYVTAHKSCELRLSASVYADTFPMPITLNADVKLHVRNVEITLAEFLPDWHSYVSADPKYLTFPVKTTTSRHEKVE